MLEEETARYNHTEHRRPEYLHRFKRSHTDIEPIPLSSLEADERDNGMPGIGITVSPNKGRRLKLFQETSEESFEESLMTGGYERYVFVCLLLRVSL